jgi:hypothetical protein
LAFARASRSLIRMSEPIVDEDLQTPEPDVLPPVSTRPTVDEMSEWSFPASDPPATWTWDVDPPRP